MEPLKSYSLFIHSAKFILHYELFEVRCEALLGAVKLKVFNMYDNVSHYTETRRAKDLTTCSRNLVVEEGGYTLDTESVHGSKYKDMTNSKVIEETSRA